MSRPNFLDENRGRSFPFLADFQERRAVAEESLSVSPIYDMQFLPNEAVVDFGCNLGVRTAYDPNAHVVYLAEVRRQESNLVFEFRCTSPDLVEHVLLFSRAATSRDFETEYSEAVFAGVEFSQSISECGGDSDWEGYLTTGSMELLAELLANDGDKLKGDLIEGAIIEHALVRSLQDTFVRSLNLGNADRTRAENPQDCLTLNWPFTFQPIYVRRECLTGALRLVEGYNMVIDQDHNENSLTLNASVGGGAGEPCEEVPLFSGESPPAGVSTLAGGLRCHEVIRSINGIGGRVLDLLSGSGVSVQPDPDNHRIVVDFNMRDLALCFDEEPFEESLCSEESVSEDPICGPST